MPKVPPTPLSPSHWILPFLDPVFNLASDVYLGQLERVDVSEERLQVFFAHNFHRSSKRAEGRFTHVRRCVVDRLKNREKRTGVVRRKVLGNVQKVNNVHVRMLISKRYIFVFKIPYIKKYFPPMAEFLSKYTTNMANYFFFQNLWEKHHISVVVAMTYDRCQGCD